MILMTKRVRTSSVHFTLMPTRSPLAEELRPGPTASVLMRQPFTAPIGVRVGGSRESLVLLGLLVDSVVHL